MRDDFVPPQNMIELVEKAYSDGKKEGNPKWINVKDKLPDDYVVVILTDGKSSKSGLFNKIDGCWTWSGECEIDTDDYKPTHWMPLPNPPEIS